MENNMDNAHDTTLNKKPQNRIAELIAIGKTARPKTNIKYALDDNFPPTSFLVSSQYIKAQKNKKDEIKGLIIKGKINEAMCTRLIFFSSLF
jgi:hypothetical protein